ncbi:hypothetical protein KC19_9G116900 [Ceratodon purpureus]|uniref:mRNA (guanine-N(7))-methyltransferase n=2 Tax=Ceratodon purpureus TaxID=3225 RepID=A0A8T0GUK2_CERPU|nr:hypothetical protein KC19_9G116900 [Ceratodon purpureus]
MTAPWGAGALHQRLNAFVKKSLIQQLVPPGAVVCDLYCGRGVDTENWGEAKIGKYVGVDLSSSALEEAKEEWERNEKPFVARFSELNPCMADLEKHLGVEKLSVDVVTCLSHLQDCFASEDMVRQLLKNVASLLKPGGYFFGATPDSSTIWYKYQKAVEGAMKAGSLRANGNLPRVRTELYNISFEDDRFNEYGSRYQLRFADESVPPQSQILVHFPSLIRRAEELGLECVEIQNLTEFYEDYRVPFAETLQKSCGTLVDAKGHPVVDGKSRLSPVAQDVLSLYTTFVFKKPDPQQRERALKRPAAPTHAPVDVKNKKFSPAHNLVAPESRPLKKQRLSASPAIATSNGSKMQDTNPKQEKSSSSGSRPKPEIVSKNEPARSIVKISKPSVEPKLESSHVNVTESKSQEKVPKSDMASSEARGRTSVERMQKTESPSVSKPKPLVGQRIESPSAIKSKPSEGGQRNDSSVNLGAQELKVEGLQPSNSNMQVSSDPDTSRPSSSGLLSESNRRSGNEGPQSLEPVKKKRVSRWSSEYVPKAVFSSAGQNIERKNEGVASQHSDQGLACKKASGTPAKSQMVGDMISRLASAVREAQLVSGAQQLRDGATTASDGKPQHDGKYNHKEGNHGFNQRKSPLSKQEPREEGEVGAEDPVRSFASPKKERRVVTGPQQEGRAAQRAVLSETVSGRHTESTGSETQLNENVVQNSGSKVGPAIHEKSVSSESRSDRVAASGGESLASQPRECSTQTTTTILEPEGKALDQGNRKSDELTNQQKGIGTSTPTQKNGSTAGNSDMKKESVNPRPRKKEIAMDVLLNRTSSESMENAATCATQVVATVAAEPPSENAASKKNDSNAPTDPELARGPDHQKKDHVMGDMDFERGSKLSRDSPAREQQPEAGSTQKRESGSVLEPSSDVGRRDSVGSRRELEPAWETKPQRYTLRRAASLSEGGVESPPVWSRGTFTPKIDREHQGRGPVFHPRVPYGNPVAGFGAGLRAPLRAEERRVVPPLPGLGAGLLGAAPSPIFGDRGLPGDRRFEMMGPPEGSRGFSLSQNDLRVPRPSIRGPLYKNDRVLPAGPRGTNSDFAGEGPHIPSVSNGLGAPWEDHFQGDGRSRINR